jgi:hypothetical protein
MKVLGITLPFLKPLVLPIESTTFLPVLKTKYMCLHYVLEGAVEKESWWLNG